MIEVRAAATLRRLGALDRTAEREAGVVIKELGDDYVAVLKDETPVGKGENPGKLKGAYVVADGPTTYRITNTTPYLRYVLNGRPAVVAKAGGMLRFVISGRVFFRKRVKAAKANRYDLLARRRMQGAIDRAPRDIAARIVRAYKGSA